jgi:hypothetical protein
LGIYYSAHLMLGVEGTMKEELLENYDELETEEKGIFDFVEKIEEFFKEKCFKVLVFDPTYKEGEIEDSECSLYVGFEISHESETHKFDDDLYDVRSRFDLADQQVNKTLITDLEEHFPEFDWSPIRLRNIISVG